MSSASTQFANTKRMGIYDSNHQISMWNDLKANSNRKMSASTVLEANEKLDKRLEDIPHEILGLPRKYDQETNGLRDKVLRRLAQNREAAKKSRLRKKAYVQQLESSRIKLDQLEHELEWSRQQGVHIGGHLGESTLGLTGIVNSGVADFEMEYGHWVEEQNRQTRELRAAFQANVSEIELCMLVESGMNHYDNLFRIKAIAAKSDVFYLMSGMWRTTAERVFFWIGGFRPSELLKVLSARLDPLSERQLVAVCNLQQSSLQAEDALTQGMDKLQHTLAETLTSYPLGTSGIGNYVEQMANALEKLEALVSFVNEADHLRQEALQQLYKILTTRQAARGLIALGDYFQQLRALSALWAARPREPA
ncbi:transcription factor TGA4-like isoform X1 [Typha latifolia]|uniref:transcription factor TGA4-like isoform X1 n=2 Tax=Typha latifolia TaxID=4733 RepID=UPI003C2DEF72